MSVNDPQDRTAESDGAERFFSVKQSEKRESLHSESIAPSDESEDQDQRSCLTLRVLQFLLPCLRNKGVWEPSQGDVFKSHDAEEAKYPRTLRILESRTFDVIFVCSCFMSIYLFLFSEGFLLESRLLWGVIHLVNAIYALGLFSQWLQILIKSKYAKTNHGYTTRDILYTLVSVFPADLIVLVIYTLNDEDDNEDNEAANPIEHWMITVSRLNYFLRIRSILQYFSKWENRLVVGDFTMFCLRTYVFTSFLIHLFACIWHRLACKSFRLKHFLMTPDEATTDVCDPVSWMGTLKLQHDHPLLDKPWHVLWTHYWASVYWTIITTFRLGASDIDTTLRQNSEVAFVTFTEITAWIYVLVNISGTLASLFIEKDAEKEHFLTRCFAIRHFLKFTEVAKSVQDEIYRFYNYLWKKSKGILKIDLIEVMPHAMKAAVFYDVNKFVMDQLPMLKGLDTPFLMSLSVHTTHKFFLSGEIFFRKNDTAGAMYYLVKGHLEILSEDERHVMATIRSGSIIGEIHLLQPYPHIATVRCGSDCDVLVLSRKHFRRVLNVYPQYISVLEQRLENRLEQSGLLLALCEKHNTYQKAFKQLHEHNPSDLTVTDGESQRESGLGRSFENVTKILAGSAYEAKPSRNSEDDYDGLEIPELHMSGQAGSGGSQSLHAYRERERRNEKQGFEEKLAAAYLALETDVARAGSLATDLNIPRPPLIVAAPDSSIHVTLGFHQDIDSENVCVRLFKQLKEPTKGIKDFMWKFVVSACALAVFWYYPYQFAFRTDERLMDFVFHFTDFIFFLDCIYDMMQVVVTPKRTFESFKEIMGYRLKTVYFYIRVLSILPLEYIIATPFGIDDDPTPGKTAYFYLFKFNRLFQIHLVAPFLTNFEARFPMSPVIMATLKLAMGVFFVAHYFAVGYKFVMRDVNGKNSDSYVHSFYRSLVITTATGYGDIRSNTNLELVVECLGLMAGVAVLIYLQAKVMAMLCNNERQRVSFQQMYYSLKDFMNHRKFPKPLRHRVSEYYRLQWKAHEGTLVPNDKLTIWDAPKHLMSKVANSVGIKYISRVPLFMNIPTFLQTEFCLALSHFMIPPGEVLLYPDQLARDLYIIAKGYVQVIHKNRKIGVFTEGRYFGLCGVISGANPDFMFRTITHCQVLCLTYENFQKVATSNAYFFQEYQLLLDSKENEVHITVEDMSQAPNSPPTPKSSAKLSRRNSRRKSSLSMSSTRKSVDLIFPTQAFMEKLIQDSPPFDEAELLEENHVSKSGRFAAGFAQCCKGCLKANLSEMYISPNGSFLKWWLTFRISIAVLATIFAPCQLTLPIAPKLAFLITLIFDVVAWIDMIFSMRMAYLGDKNQLVTSSGSMIVNYLKGNFLFDLLTSFPADYIVYFMFQSKKNFDDKYHIVALLRLNRMLQIGNLFMANSILEKAMYRSLSLIMLVEMLPVMLVFVNVTTFFSILPICGYSVTGEPANCDNPQGWILNGLRYINYIGSVTQLLYDIIGSYVLGMYWVTQTIFAIGFGEIPIGTDETNQIIAICVIFSGIMMITYVAGKLTSCIIGEDPAKISLQEKMTVMHDHLEQHRVTKGSRHRVREVYLNAWNKLRGVSPSALFQALPPTLKTDVMKHLYGAALNESPLFESLDGPGLRMLASSLSEMYYSEGEFLHRFGDLCDDIFFIAHGAVVCYSVRGDIMAQLGSGSLIGEIGPFFHSHRLYSAIAVKDVTAYVFQRETFTNFLQQHPDIKTIIEACSLKHYKEAMMGIKKMGSLDFDVLLTFQNEKEGRGGQGEVPKVPVSSDDKNQSEKKSVQLDKKSKKSLSLTSIQQQDMTRKTLKEDVMKSPEEFSKPANEKWWYVFVTFGRMSRDEMGLIHIYQELDKCTIFNFAIHPASTACGWVSFCLVLTAFSCGITAYEIAFASTHRPTETVTLSTLRYMLEVFYVIRIIGNFHLGYYDETGTLITSVKEIARRYAYKVDGLWLDFVTTFPFYIAEHFVHVRGEYIRSLQLLRVILFVRYLRESDSSLKLKGCRVKVLKITILLCFIFHFWACAWYLVACTDSCNTGSWMQEVLNKLEFISGQSSDDSVSTTSRYLLSLYYVTNALTYTGYSEITGKTKSELMLTIAMVFAMVFVIGYLVGEMVQCLASLVATKIHYQHKLAVLENHLETLGISSTKIEEVRHYFKLLWCRCKGMMFHDLMDELPYTLRADVAMEIYGPNLKSSRIIGKLDENLIRQLCAKIRHEIYFPGSHLVRAGDVCTSMYFIKKGEVVILDGNTNLELCVEILYENECFGEVKILLPREQYRFSYVARLESEVGVLNKEDLEAVLKNHPKIYDELKEKAGRVKVRRQSLKDDDEKDKSNAPHGAVSSMSIRSAVSQHSSAKGKL